MHAFQPALIRVATCNLNQWSMEFETNLRNVRTSILEAKRQGASYRTGPELEVRLWHAPRRHLL